LRRSRIKRLDIEVTKKLLSTMWRPLAVLGCLIGVLHGAIRLHNTDFRGPFMSGPGNQMSCGGCYGFAEAAAVEWFATKVTGKLIPLSAQFYVDCFESYGRDLNGCQGGAVTDGLKYLITYQYHPYAEDYPFTGEWNPQTCKDNGVKERKRRNALADVWVYDYIRLSKNPQAVREALQNGPVIAQMLIGEDMPGWSGTSIYTDYTCATDAKSHSMCFVGWQSNNGNPYYIVRNSYGAAWGVNGYAYYADNTLNTHCDYQLNAITLSVGRRRELEYQLGVGKKNFEDAQAACKALDETAPANRRGWTLAIIPTLMHNLEVYDLFTSTYGVEKKKDDTFNYFWIGMVDGKWVDDTETNFLNADYANGYRKNKHVVMSRLSPNTDTHRNRGKWTTRKKTLTHRFVCSRYRAESCPRISQTAVDNAEALTMFSDDGTTTKEIDVGTIAVIECITGYTRVGPEWSECQSDGTWSELPACTTDTPAVNCKMPTKADIPNSRVVSGKEISPGYAAPGSTLKVKCARKYHISEKITSTCQDDGTWTEFPVCARK